MNERDLRAYARLALTARLAELDDERERVLALLATWSDSGRKSGRGTGPDAPLKRDDTVGPAAIAVAVRPDPTLPSASARQAFSTSPPEADIEVARVLPRRRREMAPAPVAVTPALTLPPMPRLVKARAS